MVESHDYGVSRPTSLAKLGGGLAIAGTLIGTAIFVLGCFGFGAAFTLALIPVGLGVVGLTLVFIGGVFQKPIGIEDTHALAGLLLSVAVICGGLLETAIWLGVPIFAGGAK